MGEMYTTYSKSRKNSFRNIWDRYKNRVNPPELSLCQEQVDQQNFASLERGLSTCLLVSVAALVIQLLTIHSQMFEETIFLSGVFLCGAPIFKTSEHDAKKCVTLTCYLWMGVIFCLDAFFEAAFMPDHPGFIFMTLMMILPPIIIDAPWRMGAFVLSTSCLYLLFSAVLGSSEIFMDNLIRILFVDSAVLVANYRTTHIQLQSFMHSNSVADSAVHDGLTGILNRKGGDEAIRDALKMGWSGAFILMDVDNFKHVNDDFGHAKGDEVLRNVAMVLKNSFRSSDVVMRMGGDEFIIYAMGIESEKTVENKLNTLRDSLHGIYLDPSTGEHITCSMGCLINHGTYPNYETMYAVADRLLYKVKRKGKDSYFISEVDYHPEVHTAQRVEEFSSVMEDAEEEASLQENERQMA